MEGLTADVLIENHFPSFLICYQVCVPTLVLRLYHASLNRKSPCDVFSQHSAPCKVTAYLATEKSLFWPLAVITFVKWKNFFLWLANCIWLYHIPHLWHLEQSTFKTFWDNCLYQPVCVEDPPCTTYSLPHSHLWYIWAVTWVACILHIIYWFDFRIFSLGCPLVYVNIFQQQH